MKKQLIYIIPFLFLIILSGCRKDEIISSIDKEIPSPDKETISGVSGIVIDENGDPISNTQVIIDGNSSQTDANGYFKFLDIALDESGQLIKFKQAGYYDGYKFVYPETNSIAYTKIQLIQKIPSSNFESQNGGILKNKDAQINIPANAIVDESGTTYNGEVVPYVKWYDPTDPMLANNMPGDLRGITTENVAVQLATYGMIAVELESPTGEKLQLGNGLDATINMPIPGNLSNDSPSEIPLWHLNETTGEWIEEGKAIKEGNQYVGQVSHFSFWNCDAFFEAIKIKGVIVDHIGNAVPNILVTINVESLAISATGYTNSNGVFCGLVPKDEELNLSVIGTCDNKLIEIVVPPSSLDIILDDINLDQTNDLILIEGQILKCNMDPIQNGYLVVQSDEGFEILVGDSEGNISGYISHCSTNPIKLSAYDFDTNYESEILLLAISGSEENFGTISTCSEDESFVILEFDDQAQIIMENMLAYILDDNQYIIYAEEPISKSNILIKIEQNQDGSFFTRLINSTAVDAIGILRTAVCAYSIDTDCSNIDLSVNEVSEIDDMLIGNLSGVYESQVYNINLDFKIPITSKLQSSRVSGRVWLDENVDGIRDPSEPPADIDDYLIQLRPTFGSSIPLTQYDLVAVENPDGTYYIEDIMPNHEYYLFYQGSLNATLKDRGGDDSMDNDYSIGAGGFTATDPFYLGLDQEIENIDLGLTDQTVTEFDLDCNISISGCGFNSTITTSVTGGVAPYTYSWNSGQTLPMIQSVAPGTYSITITDANGYQVTCQADVPINQNKISGFIWEDIQGGIDNIYDPGIDLLLEGINVTLTDEDFVFLSTTDENGRYIFVNSNNSMEAEVSIEIPSSYQMLDADVGPDDKIDCDFNPDGSTVILTPFSECDTKYILDAGFKKI